MERFDRVTSWVIFAIGVVHCGVTFVLFDSYSDRAVWFFSGGLAMVYCAALNLMRVRYLAVAPGLRATSATANLSMLGFILVYALGKGMRIFQNPFAVLLVGCALAVTILSVVRRPAGPQA